MESWKERFQWIYQIIKTGKPWSDSVIVINEKTKQIAEFINKKLYEV